MQVQWRGYFVIKIGSPVQESDSPGTGCTVLVYRVSMSNGNYASQEWLISPNGGIHSSIARRFSGETSFEEDTQSNYPA
jgi:hypothetical protein